jgi:hypothetical protein
MAPTAAGRVGMEPWRGTVAAVAAARAMRARNGNASLRRGAVLTVVGDGRGDANFMRSCMKFCIIGSAGVAATRRGVDRRRRHQRRLHRKARASEAERKGEGRMRAGAAIRSCEDSTRAMRARNGNASLPRGAVSVGLGFS